MKKLIALATMAFALSILGSTGTAFASEAICRKTFWPFYSPKYNSDETCKELKSPTLIGLFVPYIIFLANGKAIPSGTTLNSQVAESLTMEDKETLAGAAAILCQMTLDGKDGAEGEGEINEILNSAGEKLGEVGGLALLGTGSGSECLTVSTCAEGTASSPIEVWPVGLPWVTQLVLETSGEFLSYTGESTEGKPIGWELLCLVLGLNITDTCTAEVTALTVQNDPETGDAEIPALSVSSPSSKCTQSSKATGRITTDSLALMKLTNGELLTLAVP